MKKLTQTWKQQKNIPRVQQKSASSSAVQVSHGDDLNVVGGAKSAQSETTVIKRLGRIPIVANHGNQR